MLARPGLCGMGIGRLGLVAASQPSLVAQALAILAKYGGAANLYLPGVGAINGITAGNWLDTVGGTNAATVDSAVGLVVSAGKPSPELVINGTFASGIAEWAPTDAVLSHSGGKIRIAASAAYGRANQSFATVIGKTYLATATSYFISGTSGSYIAKNDNGVALNSLTSAGHTSGPEGDKFVVFTATSTTTFISLGVFAIGSLFEFDNVSVRELPGAHLTQSTAANRPVLRLSGGVYAWDFVSSDSFTSTLTPGNAGFFCSSANVTDSGVLRTLLGAGAGSDASSGVWLARAASNALTLQVGNGTTRNSVSAAYPVATNSVASAGWDASNMFVGINGAETSGAKSVNCTSANKINIGVLTGTTNPMLGTISGGAIIMPTVLPTASERATLRQLIASLSGVTL